MDLKQIFKHCYHLLNHYGAENQVPKAIEELCEVIIELSRHVVHSSPRDKVQDEIADALIMLIQMAQLFGMNEVRSRIEFKLDRQNKRIFTEKLDDTSSLSKML